MNAKIEFTIMKQGIKTAKDAYTLAQYVQEEAEYMEQADYLAELYKDTDDSRVFDELTRLVWDLKECGRMVAYEHAKEIATNVMVERGWI